MAPTNRERVTQALELLAGALGPVVERVLAPHVPDGHEWPVIQKTLDEATGRDVSRQTYGSNDLHLMLRVTTKRLGNLGFPFSDTFSRAESNLLNEVAVIRNRWAHMEQFSSDDTLRALDTVERLLAVLDAPEATKSVRTERMALNRRVYEEQARADTRHVVTGPEDEDLEPWHHVLRPRQDVLDGRQKESDFAANLHSVATGAGDLGSEYTDPRHFFRITYVTEGLQDLLEQAAGRVSGAGDGDPVINLQTTFGGGKTHSMLAVWHLFSRVEPRELPDEIQGILQRSGATGRSLPVRRAAIVGNEVSPGQASVKEDGTQVRTLWGELAWQLGGPEGFALVADADATATNPGSALRELLARYSPCVVLIDEWVAYARQLHERDGLPGGSFDTQFTFAQALTEAVSQTPGALLLVSIPASDSGQGEEKTYNNLETGGHHGLAALKRLENVVGRTAHQWQPATSHESFEIVRRRLFREVDAESGRKIRKTARRFADFYRQNADELPREVREASYEERIRLAFPIHPELFDRLYEDWSTLERFQRTRGVLRLMSTVVRVLVEQGDRSALIMPGTVPVGADRVRSEMRQYIDPSWSSVIDADVDGPDANAVVLDREKPVLGSRSVATRLARTLFMASAATVESSHKGATTPELFLGLAVPGDVLGNFHSGLSQLEDRSSYIFHDSVRHWLDLSPSLNRTARDRAGSLSREDVDAEIVRRLKLHAGDPSHLFHQVILAPTDGADVPEGDETRLVVLGTEHAHRNDRRNRASSAATDAARDITIRRGGSGRERRNTLLFLAPDENRLEELRTTVREHLAWRSIVDEAEQMDLRQEQLRTARTRLDEENARVGHRITGTWIWCLAPRQKDGRSPDITITINKADDQEKRLAVRAEEKFRSSQDLLTRTYSPALIRNYLEKELHRVWNRGHVSVAELWDLHTKFLYLPRLRRMAVMTHGLEGPDTLAVDARDFWFASAFDESTGDYANLVSPAENAHRSNSITADTLLVRPEIAEQQRLREEHARQEAEAAAEEVGTSHTEGLDSADMPRPEDPVAGTPPGFTDPSPRELTRNVSYEGSIVIHPGRDITAVMNMLAEEIIENLNSCDPDALDVRVSISAKKIDGFDERTVRNVTENAKNIGVRPSNFQDG